MRASYLFALCLLGGALSLAQAPAASDKAADEVKAYCAAVDEYKSEAKPLLFADASDQPKPAWRRVGTERELEALTDALFQHSTTAKVWLKAGKVVAVETDAASGTGDWQLAAEYCFRDDGSLAALHSELRNDADNYIAIRDEAFEPGGNASTSNAQFIDSRSHKPKKLSKQAAANEQRAPMYHTPSELPFQRLLKLQ
jgi:hypothetical protein